MRKKQARKLKRLIRAYANAQEAYSWRGKELAVDIPPIEERFQEAKKVLFDFIKTLTVEPFTGDTHERIC